MLWLRVILRVCRHHSILHLVLPLIIALSLEAVFAVAFHDPSAGDTVLESFSLSRAAVILGPVLLTFGIVAVWYLNQTTSIGIAQIDSAMFTETLRSAESYFALATIGIDEWFQPSPQVYLAKILARRLAGPPFRYERVICFTHESSIKHLDSDYLDGYQAKAFIEIHKRLAIPLAFVRPGAMYSSLRQLTREQRRTLRLRPLGFYWYLCRWKIRERMRIALVDEGSHQSVMQFQKRRGIVTMTKITDPEQVAAYEAVVREIEHEIFDPTWSRSLKPDRDFTRYYSG